MGFHFTKVERDALVDDGVREKVAKETNACKTRLGSRVGSEPWYRYSVSIATRADHSMPNSTVASTN